MYKSDLATDSSGVSIFQYIIPYVYLIKLQVCPEVHNDLTESQPYLKGLLNTTVAVLRLIQGKFNRWVNVNIILLLIDQCN